jgi:hypothetical protein
MIMSAKGSSSKTSKKTSTSSKRQKKAKPQEERAYLTKRVVANAARKSFKEAAAETMEVMGYNVIAKDGWVVKVDKDGNILEKISPIPRKKHLKTRLD